MQVWSPRVVRQEPRVVAGGNVVSPQVPCGLHEASKFPPLVAPHTGVRREARHVTVDEVLHDRRAESIADVENLMRNAQLLGHKAGDADLATAPLLPLLRGRRIVLRLPGLQRDALYLIALLQKDRRRDSAGHPARHANHNRPLHRYRAPPRCETRLFAASGADSRGSSSPLLLTPSSASQFP